jgi:TonB family protein
VSLKSLSRWFVVVLLLIAEGLAGGVAAWGQEEVTRKTKSKVAPVYPELARRMNITGVVKIQVTVDKGGNIKNTKLVGGHPVLANAALDAIKKWKYEAGPEETTGIVEFRFDPNQ